MADEAALFAHLKNVGLGSKPITIPDGAVTVNIVARKLNDGQEPSQYQRLKANRILLEEHRKGALERARWGREWYYWMKEAKDGKAKKRATRTKGA